MASKAVYNIVVIGVGIAGRVRIRDLREAETLGIGLKLAGFVSRRSLDIENVSQIRLDEALKSPDVDAVAVCTEPGAHEETVEKALISNKHVLVEYPVATTSEKARSLYSLAEQKGLVLHEENIALLTESHVQLKEKVSSSCALKSGEIKLKGNYNGWIEDFANSGLPFTTNVSIIQMVLDVFGDVKGVSASCEHTDEGYVATGEVQTLKGAIIKLSLERHREKVPRVKTLKFVFEDGSVFDSESDRPPQGQGQDRKKGLFMQDLEMFADKLRGQRSKTEGSGLSVQALEIADQLNSFITEHSRT